MSSSGKHEMTKDDASRVQSTQASGGKDVGAGSFASRAQSAGDKNSSPAGSSKSGSASSSGSGGSNAGSSSKSGVGDGRKGA